MVLEDLRHISVAFSLLILVPLTLAYAIRVFFPMPSFVETAEYKRALSERETLQKQRDQAFHDQQVLLKKKSDEFSKQLDNKQLETLEKQLQEKAAALEAVRTVMYKTHDTAVSHHNTMELLIAALIGLLLMILGLIVPVSAIGSGLLFGGTLCVIYGFISHRNLFGEKMLFLILLGAIGLIIALGSLFLGNQNKSK